MNPKNNHPARPGAEVAKYHQNSDAVNFTAPRTGGRQIDYGEIAELVGVTRAHARNRLTKQPDFPAPCVRVSTQIIRWQLTDVLAWMAGSTRNSRSTIGDQGVFNAAWERKHSTAA